MTDLNALIGTREIPTPADMNALGKQLGEGLVAGDILVLTGPLGAGKTTLTRGIAEGLGVRGPVQSPTFVVARTHPSLVGGPALIHVDAYRLGSAAELDDLDLDLEHAVTIIEWGREMVEAIADEWWELEIDREWHGHGVDSACGTVAREAELDADTPRIVTLARRP